MVPFVGLEPSAPQRQAKAPAAAFGPAPVRTALAARVAGPL
jgi:hypothetical protein